MPRSEEPSRVAGVHVVFVARPEMYHQATPQIDAVITTASNIVAWSAQPRRLEFHLLAGTHALSALSRRGLRRRLDDLKEENLFAHQLHVVNASDEALRQNLCLLGKQWLDGMGKMSRGKARTYTAPKLFLYSLMPPDISRGARGPAPLAAHEAASAQTHLLMSGQ